MLAQVSPILRHNQGQKLTLILVLVQSLEKSKMQEKIIEELMQKVQPEAEVRRADL